VTERPTATADGSSDDPRVRLARYIAGRRHELGLSAARAASDAGVARNTWSSAENGSREVRSENYAGIERALRWAPGSVAAILEGGYPTGVAFPEVLSASAQGVEVEIDRISHLPIPAEVRLNLIRRVLDLYDEAQHDREQQQTTPT
jgi:transcriptional regulator with XRE-family HTH domain